MKVFKFFLAGTAAEAENKLNEITGQGWVKDELIAPAPGHPWVIIAWKAEK